MVLVEGAINDRQGMVPTAKLLAARYTVFNYDRRGRGDSGNTLPYSVQREIEDIEAVIDKAGGSAFVYGHSSGASLAMEAAASLGGKVRKLAMYEAPYNDAPPARQAWGRYLKELTTLLAADRRGDAVALFMRYVGLPEEQVDAMRHSPAWPRREAIAPTLMYDHPGIMGDDASIPVERARRVQAPTLLMNGGAGAPFMYQTALTLSRTIPRAQLRTLEGQTHAVSPDVLVPVLAEFFGA